MVIFHRFLGDLPEVKPPLITNFYPIKKSPWNPRKNHHSSPVYQRLQIWEISAVRHGQLDLSDPNIMDPLEIPMDSWPVNPKKNCYICAHTHTRMFKNTHVYIYIYRVYIYNTYICIYIYICVCVCTFAHVYIYRFTPHLIHIIQQSWNYRWWIEFIVKQYICINISMEISRS